LIFLDASVVLAAEDLDDSNHAAAAALLTTGALGTLDLAAYETTNVAEARWRDSAAGRRLRDRILAIAEFGVLLRVDRALGDRTAELSRQHALSGERVRRSLCRGRRAGRRAAGDLRSA
jgi:predicted nucleic acid-binding protein